MGLVNGSRGTVTHISLQPGKLLHGTIFVQFDNKMVGKKLARTVTATSLIPHGSVPITSVVSRFSFGNFIINRCQYPITLAWASTIHKVQGQTLDKIVVSFAHGRFSAGQAYVALSHTRTLDGLFLMDFNPAKIHANSAAKKEMGRLRTAMPFFWVHPLFQDLENVLSIGHLNIRSLQAHWCDLVKSSVVDAVSILTLSEANCSDPSSLPAIEGHTTYYCNSPHGLACLVKSELTAHLPGCHIVGLEAFSVVVLFGSLEVLVIVAYKPPQCSLASFLTKLHNFLVQLPLYSMPAIITGDINVNLLGASNNRRELLCFMADRGFSQKVLVPTHRDGGLLDHIYVNSNVHVENIVTSDCYFTDHKLVCARIKLI